MAATSYDSLIPYIQIDTEGAPHPLIVSMINLAARELCTQAQCWTAWEVVELESGVNEYAVSAPSSSAVVRAVQYITMRERKALIPESEANVLETKRHLIDATGEPECYYMVGGMAIRVLPTPSDADSGKEMRVKASYIPSLDATSIPSEFIERYSEALVAGAKFNLMSMPGKPWSNPQLAVAHKQIFDVAIDKARIEVDTSFSTGSMKVSARKFGY